MNLLNLTHFKSKVQWWAILSLFGIVLAFTACEKDCICDENEDPIEEEYPSLKIVNQNTSLWWITSVKLVGYEFYNLEITKSESQTFVLDKGMPGGYNDINVKVYYTYGAPNGSQSIKVNFSDGATTTIALKGCTGSEGCDGLYLEYNP